MTARRTARALVQRRARHVELIDLSVPDKLADGHALAQVEGSGLCGSDSEQYAGHFDGQEFLTYPVVMGHEPVVRITELTPTAAQRWSVRVGDRVAVEPHVGCGVCEWCTSGRVPLCPNKKAYGYVPVSEGCGLWGSLAEQMVLHGNTVLHPIPDHVSIEDALLFNPLGAGFEWAVTRTDLAPGSDILVIGAGQRGLACVLAAKVAGARRITVVGLARDRRKLALANAIGATEVVVVDPADPDGVLTQVGVRVFDCAVDVTPAATEPVLDAIRAVRAGGTVVLAGLKGGRGVDDFPNDEVVMRAITVRGVNSVTSASYRRAVDLIVAGRIDFSAWHTHRFPLERVGEALELLGDPGEGEEPIHISVLPQAPN